MKKKKKKVDKIVPKEDFTVKFLKFDSYFNTKTGRILYFSFLILYLLVVFMLGYYINNIDNHYYKTGFIYYFRIIFVFVLVNISFPLFFWRFYLFFYSQERNSILYNLLCWFLGIVYLALSSCSYPFRYPGSTWSESLDIVPNIIMSIINHSKIIIIGSL